jgi:hypothetical protein
VPQGTLLPSAKSKSANRDTTCSAELQAADAERSQSALLGLPVNWLAKFWIIAVLIPFWGAVIAVLLHRLHGDSKT